MFISVVANIDVHIFYWSFVFPVWCCAYLSLLPIFNIRSSVCFLLICGWFFFFRINFFFINLFLAALCLHCCTQSFSSCCERGLLFVAVRGLLIVVASLVVEHGL